MKTLRSILACTLLISTQILLPPQALAIQDLKTFERQIPSGKWPSWLSEETVKRAVEATSQRSNNNRAPFAANSPQAAGRAMVKGTLITVDTRDTETCYKVYDEVKRMKNVTGTQVETATEACRYEPSRPALSFVIMEEVDYTEYVTPIDASFIKSTDPTLTNDTRNLSLAMLGTMGILWLMPEASTGWDKNKIKDTGPFENYWENVKNGPVIDKDNPRYNYIGHPLAGAAYYTMARHRGLSRMQSFGYSVLMSTFFWEYGFEAFAEKPSIQDLIITPVVGALLGEIFYQLEQSIKANDGKVLGSKKLGKVVMVLLNPMGSLSNGINRFLGRKFIQSSETELVLRSSKDDNPLSRTGGGNYIGFRVKFLF